MGLAGAAAAVQANPTNSAAPTPTTHPRKSDSPNALPTAGNSNSLKRPLSAIADNQPAKKVRPENGEELD